MKPTGFRYKIIFQEIEYKVEEKHINDIQLNTKERKMNKQFLMVSGR